MAEGFFKVPEEFVHDFENVHGREWDSDAGMSVGMNEHEVLSAELDRAVPGAVLISATDGTDGGSVVSFYIDPIDADGFGRALIEAARVAAIKRDELGT